MFDKTFNKINSELFFLKCLFFCCVSALVKKQPNSEKLSARRQQN